MALAEGIRDFILRVRNQVQDRGSQAWSDAEIIEAVNGALEEVQSDRRVAGLDLELDRLDIPFGDFTQVDQYWHEYRLPETVMDVRAVEGVISGRPSAVPIRKERIEGRASTSDWLMRSDPRWIMSRHARPGSFSVVGVPSGRFASIRVWFIRRYPELHYGVATVASTDTTLVMGTPIGPLLVRSDVYTGLDVVFESGAVAGRMTRISAYDGATATLADTLPASCANATYSLVVPIEPEHLEYLVHKTAYLLMGRAGNVEYLGAMGNILQFFERRFRNAINTTVAEPKRLWSSRT